MPCGFFHKNVNKVWVYKPLLSRPELSDWVFVSPVNRNYYIYSPFTATVEYVTSGISSWKNITFSNGIILRMNNRFNLSVGDTVNEGDVIGAAGPISYAGIDDLVINNGLAFPDVFGVSGSDISEFIGDDIRNVPNDLYSCIDCECSGEKSIVLFHPLINSYQVSLVVCSEGDTVDAPDLSSATVANFSGWYTDRKYTHEYNGIVEKSGIIFVWAKWNWDDTFTSREVTLIQSQNVLKPNSIDSANYTVGISGSSVPWMIDEDESEKLYGNGIVCIGSYVSVISSFRSPVTYDAEGFYQVTYIGGQNYIMPFVMYTKSIPKDESVGVFLSPIGYQDTHSDKMNVEFEQTLYSGDVSWYVDYPVSSNTIGPGSMIRVYPPVPSGKNRIYIYGYAYGGTPSAEYIPDIIPILFVFSSRLTGLPSINMFKRYIVK